MQAPLVATVLYCTVVFSLPLVGTMYNDADTCEYNLQASMHIYAERILDNVWREEIRDLEVKYPC